MTTKIDMSNSLYLIHMVRYGSSDNHSYFWGLWKKYEDAEKAAKEHMVARAGKYDAEIMRSKVGEYNWEKSRIIRWGDFDPNEVDSD